LLREGGEREARKEYDAALELNNHALALGPTELLYRSAAARVRFQTAQSHVDLGKQLRTRGACRKLSSRSKPRSTSMAATPRPVRKPPLRAA
jgi:hypothetical protein